MWAGVQNDPGQYLTAGETATTDELQAAQQNQSFWNQQYANFNPQSVVQTSAPSGQAFNNIAKDAQGVAQAGLGAGPTGSAHLGQMDQNRQASATSSSKTEDLNNFLNNMNANQKSGEERELSMFGNSQGQNEKNNELFGTTPEQANISQQESQQNIANEFNDWNQDQPNVLNSIAGAAAGAFGKAAGNKLGQTVFGKDNWS